MFAVICGASGCQLSRSFFQIDSDSRSPFFGVDLTPGWPQSAESTQSVDHTETEPTPATRVETELASVETPKPHPLTLPFGEATSATSLADTAPIERFR
jgi:hypothetical protein